MSKIKKTIQFSKPMFVVDILTAFKETCESLEVDFDSKEEYRNGKIWKLRTHSAYPYQNLSIVGVLKENSYYEGIQIEDAKNERGGFLVGYTKQSVIDFMTEFTQIFQGKFS